MLRPACLLSAERLAPVHGLLTPRSGTEVSLHYLGPATRRSDAYRDGTLTRWTCAACSSTTSPSRVNAQTRRDHPLPSRKARPMRTGRLARSRPPTSVQQRGKRRRHREESHCAASQYRRNSVPPNDHTAAEDSR